MDGRGDNAPKRPPPTTLPLPSETSKAGTGLPELPILAKELPVQAIRELPVPTQPIRERTGDVTANGIAAASASLVSSILDPGVSARTGISGGVPEKPSGGVPEKPPEEPPEEPLEEPLEEQQAARSSTGQNHLRGAHRRSTSHGAHVLDGSHSSQERQKESMHSRHGSYVHPAEVRRLKKEEQKQVLGHPFTLVTPTLALRPPSGGQVTEAGESGTGPLLSQSLLSPATPTLSSPPRMLRKRESTRSQKSPKAAWSLGNGPSHQHSSASYS
jgi:hypothetical protein